VEKNDFPRVLGPIFLGLMAVTGVFARGLVNGFYALLALWGVLYLLTAKKKWWLPTSPLPSKYLWGLGLYLGVTLLTTLTGSDYGRGLAHLGNVAYLLAGLPLAWLALSQSPGLIRWLVPLYGLGLLVVGVVTFQQAGFGLACVRAKASLGILELGAVLSQLVPLIVGAWAVAHQRRDRLAQGYYAGALILAMVALQTNCTRIALICVPVLTLMTLWAHRDAFSLFVRLALLVAIIVAAVPVLSNQRIVDRFQEMTEETGNYNNEVRFNHWRQGWRVFQGHPLLGVGPRAIPNAPPVEHPLYPELAKRERPKYYHAHQVFLTILAESGLVGLAGFLALHLAPILILWPYRRDRDPQRRLWVWGAFVVALQLGLNGLTDSVFTLKPLMYVYWVVTGAALWVTSQPPGVGGSSPAQAKS
jgi:O-antigen ligase